jgi:hypothetical protein
MAYKSSFDQRRYGREHYYANRQKYLASKKRRQVRLRAYVDEVKNVPCKDCGVRYPPYVMQFDHLGDKSFTISEYARNGNVSWPKLRREIAKCEVVCANCHFERTHQRLKERVPAAAPMPVGDGLLTLF